MTERRKIIIDTDPGQDDAAALMLAFASRDELDILGITTVAGNVPLRLTSRNARIVCELCGRTDLPGSDPKAMYDSLTNKLARVPDTATLFPGHFYAPEPSANLGATRRENFVFAPRSEAQWLAMFGR